MYRLPCRCLSPASVIATIGSSSYLCVPCTRTTIPKARLLPFSHLSLPETDSSSPPSPPPCLSDSRRLRSLDSAKIFFNMSSICCSAAACRHHGSRNPPPYLLSHLLCTELKYWPKGHSLCYRCLLLVLPHRFSSCRLNHPVWPLFFPSLIP